MKKGKSESIDITRLRLCDFNPNEMSKQIYAHLKKTISERGFMQPLTVALLEGEYKIIDGHHRLKACKELGWTEIPCYVMEGKTERDIKIDLINMNRTRGEFSEQKYQELVKNLANEMDTELIKDLLNLEETFQFDEEKPPEEDFNPEREPKYKVSKGEIYQLGNHRLMCGDSTSEEDVNQLMDGEKADMVFTDPPYGINVVRSNSIGSGGPFGGIKKGSIMGGGIIPPGKYSSIKGDDSTQTAKKAYSVCIQLGHSNMIFWGGNYFTDFLPPSRGWVCWDKIDGLEGTTKNFSDIELAWTSYDVPARIVRHRWQGLMKASEHKESRVHPTQKPIALAVECFELFKAGNTILDLFGGSGSTLIACEQSNRRCRMMEIDPHYCSVIIGRWEEYTGNKGEKMQ